MQDESGLARGRFDSRSNLARDLVALYAGFGRWHQFRARFRVSLARLDQLQPYLPRNGRVLDLGCGYGVIANYLALAAPTCEVMGIDMNVQRIQVAQRAAQARKNVSFVVGDVTRIPLPECQAVIMSDFLHHLSWADQGRLLERLHAALRPGSWVLIQEVSTRPRWKFISSYIADVLLYREMPRFRRAEDWLALLKETGFHDLRVIRGDVGKIFARVSYAALK